MSGLENIEVGCDGGTPDIRAAPAKMRKRVPQAPELAYDNDCFLVIGYGPSEKAGEAILSLAAQASGPNLLIPKGARSPDPDRLLAGYGKVARSIRLATADTLGRPEVAALAAVALERAKAPIPRLGGHRLIIKSVSAKQRPRRPPS